MTWGITRQEQVLDNLFEAVHAQPVEGFSHDLYGATATRPEAIMYVQDPDGNCWEVTAKRHKHKEINDDLGSDDSEL
jgi:catechol-2,3-dioxygenase